MELLIIFICFLLIFFSFIIGMIVGELRERRAMLKDPKILCTYFKQDGTICSKLKSAEYDTFIGPIM